MSDSIVSRPAHPDPAVLVAAARADERDKVFRMCREAMCLACSRGEPVERKNGFWWHDHESCLASKLRDLETAAP